MRPLVLLAILVAFCAACADEPAPDATPTEPAWLTTRPENAHPYADGTLARFRKLVEGDGWRDVAWNAQGTLEAVHEKTGLAFVLIPAGEFMMGSLALEDWRFYGGKQHSETVHAFLLSWAECTQEAWVRGGSTNPSHFRGGALPVEQVSWDDCQAWCRKNGLRLPSESEWVYACRAGTTTRYWSGDDESDLARVGWYIENSGGRTHVVGEKGAPNPWGLHDVHGNVSEWCEDLHMSGLGYRVWRGGSRINEASWCRTAFHDGDSPDCRGRSVGFRPAADLPR
jgi:formylglycine-generating enzyme required for sulfatase activity